MYVEMKTFYCVTTTFFDTGRVTAHITSTVEATQIPKSTVTSISRKDIYTDWFESLEEAQQFVEEARNA